MSDFKTLGQTSLLVKKKKRNFVKRNEGTQKQRKAGQAGGRKLGPGTAPESR